MSTVTDMLKVECPSCDAKLILAKNLRLTQQKCSECSAEFTIPEKFGDYILLDITANDEFSTTHHAIVKDNDSKVVLRRLRSEYVSSPSLNNLFSEESIRLANSNEDHLVKAIATGEVNDCPYIAFEHYGVSSLKTRLKDSRPDLLEGCYLMLDILSSLEQCISQSMVHGNLKPSNLRFDEHNNIRVYDFGLSMSLIRELMKDTITIALYNNAQYIAPETVARGELTPLSDIYSLGAIFYEIVTGKQTFDGFQDVAAMHLKLDKLPEAPNHLRPGIPPALNELIMNMLAIEPGKRPQFIDKIIDQVQASIDELEKIKKSVDMESTIISDTGYSTTTIDPKSISMSELPQADEEEELKKLSQYSLLMVLAVCIVLLLILYVGLTK